MHLRAEVLRNNQCLCSIWGILDLIYNTSKNLLFEHQVALDTQKSLILLNLRHHSAYQYPIVVLFLNVILSGRWGLTKCEVAVSHVA